MTKLSAYCAVCGVTEHLGQDYGAWRVWECPIGCEGEPVRGIDHGPLRACTEPARYYTQDENRCGTCGRVWSIDEARPACDRIDRTDVDEPKGDTHDPRR